jgi:hypothetical protein
MTKMVKLWEVTGPGRDFDYTCFPFTELGAKSALECAKDWLEEAWDGINDVDEEVSVNIKIIEEDAITAKESLIDSGWKLPMDENPGFGIDTDKPDMSGECGGC